MLDLYCERTAPGLWAEPVNAFTNIGFLLAAYFCWRIVLRERVQNPGITAITVMIVAIGMGSFLFHTLPGAVTRWFDIVPIFVFQLLYLELYGRRVINLSMPVNGLLLLAFLAVAVVANQFSEMINGSLIYVPALMVILILSAYHILSRKHEPGLLLVAASVFLLALVLRSVDIHICSHFELGTHFLWHILIALVIYLAMRALLENLSTGHNGWLNRPE